MDEATYRTCKLHGVRPRPHREEAISVIGDTSLVGHLLHLKGAKAFPPV
jgi:hypothetical protein